MRGGGGPDRRDISSLTGDEYAVAMSRRYEIGDTPWDSGRPEAELIRAVEDGELSGSTVLEMGCGTGTNAIELARRGFRVKAVDLVERPIQKAREKARKAAVDIEFLSGDLTRLDLGGPFDCLVDVGVYHGIRNRDLAGFLSTLRRVSRSGTRWLCLAGNPNGSLPDGPPVVRESEFRAELEPLFRILRVREVRFDLSADFKPPAWSILSERR